MAIVLVLFVVCLSGFVYLYQFAGLRQYWRAVHIIKTTTPEENRIKVAEEFYGTDLKGVERGILAGSWMGRVWVWKGSGLKSYTVDENSIYSWFDGCSEDVKSKLRAGEGGGVIAQVIDADLNSWREKAVVGDYVVIYLVPSGVEGEEGNLGEIYAYNFWMFMGKGIDAECVK